MTEGLAGLCHLLPQTLWEIHFCSFHGLSLALEPPMDCSFTIWQTSLREENPVQSSVKFFSRVSLPRPSLTLILFLESTYEPWEGSDRQSSVHLEYVLPPSCVWMCVCGGVCVRERDFIYLGENTSWGRGRCGARSRNPGVMT